MGNSNYEKRVRHRQIGLACYLCSENIHCEGCNSEECPDKEWCENRSCSMEKELSHCYTCEEDCKKGLLKKIKPYTFTLFVKRYGEEKLLDCLENNEKKVWFTTEKESMGIMMSFVM